MSEVTSVGAREGGIGYVPTQTFSARKIAELSLGVIGEYTVNDVGANEPAVERTLEHMELVIGELAGGELNWWLMPSTIRFTWPAVTRTDTIANILADQYPPLGILNPLNARLMDSDGGLIRELEIVRRNVYDTVSNRDDAGQPELLYFDRLAINPTVSIYRVPAAAEFQIDLTVQTYSRSVIGMQGQPNQSGDLPHGFAKEWQSYLVFKTAARVGNGPVRRCPLPNVTNWDEMADRMLMKLQAYSNRERKSAPSRTKRWGS